MKAVNSWISNIGQTSPCGYHSLGIHILIAFFKGELILANNDGDITELVGLPEISVPVSVLRVECSSLSNLRGMVRPPVELRRLYALGGVPINGN